jgi:Host cell surface-exposed lipoprotein
MHALTRTVAAVAAGLTLAVTGCEIEDTGAEREQRHDTVTAPKGDKPEAEKADARLESVAEANARQSAEEYLEFQAFSRQGLIDQLKFEGFSRKAATYGADAAGADWNEQAVKSAEAYLEMQSFSRSGLIGQLEFEGFTQAQAEHGVQVAYR